MHAAEAEVNRANLDQHRYEALINTEVATKQRYETAVADATKAAANLLPVGSRHFVGRGEQLELGQDHAFGLNH